MMGNDARDQKKPEEAKVMKKILSQAPEARILEEVIKSDVTETRKLKELIASLEGGISSTRMQGAARKKISDLQAWEERQQYLDVEELREKVRKRSTSNEETPASSHERERVKEEVKRAKKVKEIVEDPPSDLAEFIDNGEDPLDALRNKEGSGGVPEDDMNHLHKKVEEIRDYLREYGANKEEAIEEYKRHIRGALTDKPDIPQRAYYIDLLEKEIDILEGTFDEKYFSKEAEPSNEEEETNERASSKGGKRSIAGKHHAAFAFALHKAGVRVHKPETEGGADFCRRVVGELLGTAPRKGIRNDWTNASKRDFKSYRHEIEQLLGDSNLSKEDHDKVRETIYMVKDDQ